MNADGLVSSVSRCRRIVVKKPSVMRDRGMSHTPPYPTLENMASRPRGIRDYKEFGLHNFDTVVISLPRSAAGSTPWANGVHVIRSMFLMWSFL